MILKISNWSFSGQDFPKISPKPEQGIRIGSNMFMHAFLGSRIWAWVYTNIGVLETKTISVFVFWQNFAQNMKFSWFENKPLKRLAEVIYLLWKCFSLLPSICLFSKNDIWKTAFQVQLQQTFVRHPIQLCSLCWGSKNGATNLGSDFFQYSFLHFELQTSLAQTIWPAPRGFLKD